MVTISRLPQDPHSTPGKLSLDGVYFCRTLELPVLDGKLGSAIPAGTYTIQMLPSPKFVNQSTDPALPQQYRDFVSRYAKAMPHIQDIPGRTLIMLHWGNDERDTAGCVIVGRVASIDWVSGSQNAFEDLYPRLHDGDTIEVVDAPNDAEDVSTALTGGV